jgi:hypothetical protein
MKVNLKDRWSIITGGSSGIGLCFARELASRGSNIVLISVQEKELAEQRKLIADEFAVKVETLLLDLTDSAVVDKVNAFLDERAIEPYIFINNAGIFSFGEVVKTSERKVNTYVDLHVRAVTLLSRSVAARMAESPLKGYILNMSSMSCWAPMPGLALYSATKAYIRVFTRSLSYEMKDSGVKVMVCCPGGIATDLFGLPANLMKLALRLHAVTTPERFTAKAVNRLLRGRQQYINGFINRLSIFFVGVTPTPIRMMIKHKMLDKGITRGI